MNFVVALFYWLGMTFQGTNSETGSLISEEIMRFLNDRSQAAVLYSEWTDIQEELDDTYHLDNNFLASLSVLNSCVHVQSITEILQKPRQYRPSLTKGIWLPSLLSAQESITEVRFRPWLALILGESRQPPGIRLIALDFFQLETVNDFCIHSGYWIYFSYSTASSSTNIRRLWGPLFTIKILLLTKDLTTKQKKDSNRAI